MTMDMVVANPVRSWLGRFLLKRRLSVPDGRPLHAYRVTEREYGELRELLYVNKGDVGRDFRRRQWSAAFCLFVAECYRREYNASGSGWSWITFEKRIGKQLTFTAGQHAEFTEDGLEGYWKRPIRERVHGRDLLGSLFVEGGLPWLLLQDNANGFGRAIAAGLRNFYTAQAERRSVSVLMSDYEDQFPQVFRNLETCQLLASIVQQLMHLAESYLLRGQADPSAFLDLEIPTWRAAFPIPLDVANGRRLLNDWLKDADQQRQERADELARLVAFTCVHRLAGEPDSWRLATDLILPETAGFETGDKPLRNTRLELTIFEGDRLLAKGGAVYAQNQDNGWAVRFPRTRIAVQRSNPAAPLSIRLLEGGLSIHSFNFEGSVVDLDEAPLIFTQAQDEWQLAGSASCALAGTHARIRVPAGFEATGSAFRRLCDEAGGAYWVESRADMSCANGEEVFRIRLGSEAEELCAFKLKGICLPYESTPSLVFVGWPRLELPAGYPFPRELLREFLNGRPLASVPRQERLGLIRYSVRNAAGETVLRRSFGVVPAEFGMTVCPGSPSRVVLRQNADLEPRILNAHVEAITRCEGDVTTVSLNAAAGQPPSKLLMRLERPNQAAGIEIRLPYPYQGASLLDANGCVSATTALLLDDLLGTSIVLFSGSSSGQTFELQLELFSTTLPHPRPWRRYRLQAGEAPLTVNLFSYQNDIVQMLGVVSEQDAYVRLTVDGKRHLLSVDVRRYHAALHRNDDGAFVLVSAGNPHAYRGVKVAAMLLPDPAQHPLTFHERSGTGDGVREFEPPPKMQQDGPWLIYPAPESSVLFRPCLSIPVALEHDCAAGEVTSLHQATLVFHPKRAPHVIADQVRLMGSDFDHSGWQYLSELRRNFAHLPLSTFQSWQCLAADREALAVAVFRLEFDTAFCERIRDELAFTWESIPLPLWARTYGGTRAWLTNCGLPASFHTSLLGDRLAALAAVVPGFDQFAGYLETGDVRQLPKVPPLSFILPGWYQILRRTHAANDDWPLMLGDCLAAWIARRKPELPPGVANLSNIRFSDAVTYLPVFMAHVTAGKASMDELSQDRTTLKFAIKLVADFDRALWYNPVYALLVSYLSRP